MPLYNGIKYIATPGGGRGGLNILDAIAQWSGAAPPERKRARQQEVKRNEMKWHENDNRCPEQHPRNARGMDGWDGWMGRMGDGMDGIDGMDGMDGWDGWGGWDGWDG